jgi:glutathione S-transferase
VPAHRDDVQRLNPLHTVPVLVDGERVVVESGAICQYLDRKVPAPPYWPAGLAGAEAFELEALTERVITPLSDLGMRYYALHADSNFASVREMVIGRVQRALDLLAKRVQAQPRGPLCGESWSAADIAVYTMVAWLEGIPRRAAQFPPAAQVAGLGWSLPSTLSAWADQHRQREDIVALG